MGRKKRLQKGDKEKHTTLHRISSLPDEILCHILSFLPTKLAFATVVFSKRWTSLCHSFTSFNFVYDGGSLVREALLRFIGFADGVMLFPRGEHRPIKNLVLRFPFKFNGEVSNKLDGWAEVANRHCVESLEICTACWASFPSNIFCCRTLVVLKLSMLLEVGNNVVSIDLPSLKTLHLSKVRIQYTSFKKLLYAPILEDLYVEKVYPAIFPYTAGNKSLPTLVKLHLCLSPTTALLSDSQIFEMEHLNKHISSSFVFPNLIHIELFFSISPFYGWHFVLQVLHQCPRLQNIVIKKEGLTRNLYCEKREYPESVPVPECLSSHLRTCFISILNYEDDLRFAAYIMKNARFLQAMTMCPFLMSPKQNRRNILKRLASLPRISPACKFSVSKLKNTS